MIKTQNKQFGDVIYTEGSSATSVWLVFLGECSLIKNFGKLKPGEKINITKQSTVIHLVKGGFSGFESFDPNKPKYKETLVVKYLI